MNNTLYEIAEAQGKCQKCFVEFPENASVTETGKLYCLQCDTIQYVRENHEPINQN